MTVFILVILLGISFFAWQYVFQIYEVKAVLSENRIKCNSNKTIELIVYPLNSFGKKVPFRSVDVDIEFEQGEDLVTTILLNNSETNVVFKPMQNCGTVNVIVHCKYSFSPIRLNFDVVQ